MNIYTNKKFFLWRKFLIGALVLILLVLVLNNFQSQIRNFFYFISSPAADFFGQSGNNASRFLEPFLNTRSLKQENNNLKEENQKLLSEILLLQGLSEENRALKEAIDTKKTSGFKIILSKTVGLDTSNDFILINKGYEDGILENMPVISSQKVLYGKVFKVYKNFSRVMLISNKNSALDVKINGNESTQKSINGAVKGSGSLSIYLDLISSDAQIKEGDILTTSALEGIFPKDLLVGKIISKDKNDLKPFQTAKVQPFFDIKNMENLFVITNYLK